MRVQLLATGAAVGLATAALMLVTEPMLAIVWDEGYTLGREARVRDWFRALADPPSFAARWRPPTAELVQQDGTPPPRPDRIDSRGKLLSDPDVLAWFWPFAREEPHGHPPFYALLGLLGDVLTPGRADLERARVGPILLFSLTAGVIFTFAAGRWGRWPATLAAGAWVLQPNLFAHGHYAAYDAVLASLWVLAVLAFCRAAIPRDEPIRRRSRWAWAVVLGVILGCAAADKLTGWFLPLPFLAWAAWRRDRSALGVVLVATAIGGVVLFAMVPPWWTDPIGGVERFLRSNLGRARTIPIRVEFLGTIYETPRASLPWYNTIAWTAMVTPVGFLAFAMAGLGSSVARRREEPIGLLIAAHWAFLMLLRSMPHTPGHDGVRLFLPAFGMLALLGGIGAGALVRWSPRWGRAAIVAAMAEGVIGLGLMMPVPLSYFSPAVGGLPGASAIGMEPTYYWDALVPEARRWLIDHTGPGESILFATNPTNWQYLRRTGELPRVFPIDPGRPRWYVLQNRPGAFSPLDRVLAREGRAEYVVRKLGVPLVWVFPYSECVRLDAARRRPSS